MRARRTFRPMFETMSARITPSSLVPYGNPMLSPVTISDDPPAWAPDPLAPGSIETGPYDEPFVGDGNPPGFGDPTPPLAV